jgi:drug/metabolite transporter (DMT)-like permease
MTALLPLAFIGLVAGPLITWSTTSVAKMLPAVAASLGFLLTPPAGIALSSLWLGEPIGSDLLLGAGLVLAGAAVAILAGRR